MHDSCLDVSPGVVSQQVSSPWRFGDYGDVGGDDVLDDPNYVSLVLGLEKNTIKVIKQFDRDNNEKLVLMTIIMITVTPVSSRCCVFRRVLDNLLPHSSY